MLVTAFVSTHRCGAVPDLHRIPSYDPPVTDRRKPTPGQPNISPTPEQTPVLDCRHAPPDHVLRGRPGPDSTAHHRPRVPGCDGEDRTRSPDVPRREDVRHYGGGVKGGPQFEQSLLFKVEQTERVALEQDSRFFYPAYVGPYGWMGIDLSARPDWTEVAELLDASYRSVATKKLIARLDAGERPDELP